MSSDDVKDEGQPPGGTDAETQEVSSIVEALAVADTETEHPLPAEMKDRADIETAADSPENATTAESDAHEVAQEETQETADSVSEDPTREVVVDRVLPASGEQPADIAPADGLVSDAAPAADEQWLPQRTAELESIVEALIFASPEPLTLKALNKLLDGEPKEDVAAAVDALKVKYETPSGLQLVEVAGGFQIVTRPDLHEWVRRLFHERSTQKLSVQALETLAVVAYRQPVTALEITEIRGVNTSGVMNTLLERHLIKIVGRKPVVGRPFMYATTKEFLIRFGLKDISDLPRVEDMAEALGIENPLLVERAPVEEQLPLDEPDSDVPSEKDADGGSDDDAGGTLH